MVIFTYTACSSYISWEIVKSWKILHWMKIYLKEILRILANYIPTGEMSQAFAPFHIIDYFNFNNLYDCIQYYDIVLPDIPMSMSQMMCLFKYLAILSQDVFRYFKKISSQSSEMRKHHIWNYQHWLTSHWPTHLSLLKITAKRRWCAPMCVTPGVTARGTQHQHQHQHH